MFCECCIVFMFLFKWEVVYVEIENLNRSRWWWVVEVFGGICVK